MNIRINKYDNLKGFAIILIVFAHVLSIQANVSYTADFLIKFVTIFHLPIFFFISGFFSKISENEAVKSFKRLFVPYLLFSLIFYVIHIMTGSTPQTIFIITDFGLWFLIALFMMKLALPILDKLRCPILTSFLLALLIGYINIDFNLLGITRFFAYLPIYLIGFYYENLKIKLENTHKNISKLLKQNIYIYLWNTDFNFFNINCKHISNKYYWNI